jgi:hypothetical protein
VVPACGVAVCAALAGCQRSRARRGSCARLLQLLALQLTGALRHLHLHMCMSCRRVFHSSTCCRRNGKVLCINLEFCSSNCRQQQMTPVAFSETPETVCCVSRMPVVVTDAAPCCPLLLLLFIAAAPHTP